MKQSTVEAVDGWWSELFGLPVSLLWRPGVVVGMHAGLGDYPGIFVAGRPGSALVSLPDWCDEAMVRTLTFADADELLRPAYWQQWGPTEDLEVLGPSTHAYLDTEPTPPPSTIAVEVVPAEDVSGLAGVVDPAEWEESGFASEVLGCFAAYDGDELVAAANLTRFREVGSDVGVLVRPDRRGEGLAHLVGAEAAGYAVRQHGIARWRARTDNAPSRAVAARLGFEDHCLQLAVRAAEVRE